jgi:hypothetical protein
MKTRTLKAKFVQSTLLKATQVARTLHLSLSRTTRLGHACTAVVQPHNAPSQYAISVASLSSLSLYLCKVDFARDTVQGRDNTGNPTAAQTVFVVVTVYTALTHHENTVRFFKLTISLIIRVVDRTGDICMHRFLDGYMIAAQARASQDRRCGGDKVLVANRGERPTRAPLFKDPGKKDSTLLAFLLA